MRDYAKVSPKFWTGETGQELARRGSEALIVALYLMTSPHSNMLGLYYQPTLYMAEETGLTPEGACKGLQECKEAGFCDYDSATKMVWVFEMAGYQIGSELSHNDKRCKGIQKDYNALPNVPFLGPFFDHYARHFNLTERREFVQKTKGLITKQVSPSKAPSKPGTGEGAGAGEGEGLFPEDKSSGGEPPSKPPVDKSKAELWKAAVSILGSQGMAEPQARTFIGKLHKDYPEGDIVLHAVQATVTEQPGDARAYLKATCQRLNGERLRDGSADWTGSAL